jgi:hypothetical protein
MIEISFLRRKNARPLKAGEKTEYRIQNTEDRIQKTAKIKVKTIKTPLRNKRKKPL